MAPVSYTHLDVYKRQPHDIRRVTRGVSPELAAGAGWLGWVHAARARKTRAVRLRIAFVWRARFAIARAGLSLSLIHI